MREPAIPKCFCAGCTYAYAKDIRLWQARLRRRKLIRAKIKRAGGPDLRATRQLTFERQLRVHLEIA